MGFDGTLCDWCSSSDARGEETSRRGWGVVGAFGRGPRRRNAARSRPDVGSREVDLRVGGEDAAVMSVGVGVALKVL